MRDPGTARPRSAAVTPAERAYARTAIRRSSLEPTKIVVKSTPACGLRVLRMALRGTLDRDLCRHIIAPVERMARYGGQLPKHRVRLLLA